MDSIKDDKSSVGLVDKQAAGGNASLPMSPVYSKRVRPVARPLVGPNRNRLDSWKEIAAHLDREVRTVQRWEKHEGLPVHRHAHLKGSTVYALKSEIDGWLRGRAQTLKGAHPVPNHPKRTGNGLNLPPDVMRQILAAFRLWLAFVESSQGLSDIEVSHAEMALHDHHLLNSGLKLVRKVRLRQRQMKREART